MSKAINSPTARLFQSSRLFSLPRPLPQPQLEGVTSTGLFRASDTATLPYPTHQAIATPASSLSRGDWGLKRSLPLKTTHHTSTPHIRVQAQDTYEHITDFSSAADHTQTAAKWAQMGVPMVKKPEGRTGKNGPGESVYESWLDNTDPNAPAVEMRSQESLMRDRRRLKTGMGDTYGVPPPQEVKPRQRWKHNGPWIAGMQESEFNEFLESKIESRKGAWREFLRNKEVAALVSKRKTRARDEGNPLTAQQVAQLERQLVPSDAQLAEVEKRLRDEHVHDFEKKSLSSTLTGLITEFLDLPTIPVPKDSEILNVRDKELFKNINIQLNAEDGPPSTHPGAGLSYIRTNAIMENHPLHGPQKYRSPVEARVVRPRVSSNGPNDRQNAQLGVGGFVTNDPKTGTYNSTSTRGIPEDDRMAHMMDPDMEGGNRMWVQPETAHTNDNGTIRLNVARADTEAVAVKKGEVEALHEAKRNARAQQTSGLSSAGGREQFAARPVTMPRFSNSNRPAPRSRMQGFGDSDASRLQDMFERR